MKLLLIKLSSLGDLLHVFPALTELQKIHPDLEVTWVVESVFKEVPFWHPAVKHVIVAPMRQIKKERFHIKIKTVWQLIKEIRKQKYDVVVDAQGLFKSALFSLIARGKTFGFGKGSAREAVWWLYGKRVDASWDWHAVERQNALFTQILQNPPAQFYSLLKQSSPFQGCETRDEQNSLIRFNTQNLDYALQPWQPKHSKILFFAHGTTWASKHYPDILWQELVKLATAAGFKVWLPYVNDKELKRAEFLKVNNHVTILPKMSLTAIKEKLYEVDGMISVDTGLAHIAAAIGVPNITLYGPTDPKKIGTMGQHQVHLAAQFTCAPCEKKICFHPDRFTEPSPPCFRMLQPKDVFQLIVEYFLIRNNNQGLWRSDYA